MTTELAGRAGIAIRAVGGLELIAAAEAPAFLDACSGVGARVLGVEGFRIWEGGVEPDMNAIADLSGVLDPDDSVAEARGFVSAAASDLSFDFTLA